MQRLAMACADQFVEQGVVPAENRDIYIYGLEVLFSAGGYTIVALLLGQATGFFTEVLLFLLAFMPLRCFIGGYHATTPGACLLLSLCTTVMAIYVGRWLSPSIIPVLLVASVGLIFRLAPVIHPNHPHTKRRRLVLKRRARVVGVAEGIVILTLQFTHPELAAIMTISFLAASLGMPLAIWRGQTMQTGK